MSHGVGEIRLEGLADAGQIKGNISIGNSKGGASSICSKGGTRMYVGFSKITLLNRFQRQRLTNMLS